MRRLLIAIVCVVALVIGALVLAGSPGDASSKGLTPGPVDMPSTGIFFVNVYNPTTKPITVHLSLRAKSGTFSNPGTSNTVPANATRSLDAICGPNGTCSGTPYVDSTKVVVNGFYQSFELNTSVPLPFGVWKASA